MVEKVVNYTFNSLDEATGFIARELFDNELDITAAKFISTKIAESLATSQVSPGTNLGYNILTKRWVIRNDDMAILEATAPIVVALATLLPDPRNPSSIASMTASALLSLVVLAKNLRHQRVTISHAQYELLALLKLYEGKWLSIEFIQKSLKHSSTCDEISETIVEDNLNQLMAIENEGGTTANLVQHDSFNNWRAHKY